MKKSAKLPGVLRNKECEELWKDFMRMTYWTVKWHTKFETLMQKAKETLIS